MKNVESLLLLCKKLSAAAGIVVTIAVPSAIATTYPVTAFVVTPDTKVTISDMKDRINKGGSLTYYITVHNTDTNVRKPISVRADLPLYVNTVNPDHGGRVVGNKVVWDNVDISQSYSTVLQVRVGLLPSIPDGTELVARVTADFATASDKTLVFGTGLESDFSASITDNVNTAHNGDTLHYKVTVRNVTSFAQTTTVTAITSQLTDVVSMSGNGQFQYPNILWKDIEFAPKETKTFTYTAKIENRTPIYAGLRTSVRVGTVTASDTTVLQRIGYDIPARFLPSNSNPTFESDTSVSTNRIVFRKTADSYEAVPGGIIHYTLYVKNTLSTPIHSAVVTDRFNPALQSVVDANGAEILGSGTLRWALPVLLPGQTWTKTYALVVAHNVPNGTVISNIATISGNDIATVSLDEKVNVFETQVLTEMPATGAAFDLLFLLSVLPLAIAGAAMQMKLKVIA